MSHPSKIPAVPEAKDPSFDDLTDLVSHIVETHHTFTRSELARLFTLADQATSAHGDAHPELARVHELVVALADDLLPHLDKEERMLFPYVVALETAAAGGPLARPPFGTVARPIRVMRAEHERAEDILVELRRVTGDYAPPAEASGSYRALYEGLASLDRDLAEHIHLENDVLFPRAELLEQRLDAPVVRSTG